LQCVAVCCSVLQCFAVDIKRGLWYRCAVQHTTTTHARHSPVIREEKRKRAIMKKNRPLDVYMYMYMFVYMYINLRGMKEQLESNLSEHCENQRGVREQSYMYMYMHMYVYMYMCRYMYMYMYIYMYSDLRGIKEQSQKAL